MDTYLITSSLPKYNNYVDCMVAFVDIFGFNSRVINIKSEDDFHQVGRVLFKLKEIAKYFDAEGTLSPNLNVTAISDSVIFSMPVQDPMPSAISLISILHWLQYNLLINDKLLMRGYMTRGPIYHKDNIIFGLGYSEAYRNEKEIGHAPRIVIDPCLIKDAKDAILNAEKPFYNHILNYVMEDYCDGYYYIDYLKPVGMQAIIVREQLIAQREKMKVSVKEKLSIYSDNAKILRKYNWLSNYVSLTEHYYE